MCDYDLVLLQFPFIYLADAYLAEDYYYNAKQSANLFGVRTK